MIFYSNVNMHLEISFYVITTFFIFFGVSTIAQINKCDHYYNTFNHLRDIYRFTTEDGYFDKTELLLESNLICKRIELNRFKTLKQLVDSSTWTFITQYFGRVDLHITESNIPELNIELFPSETEAFKVIRIIDSNVSRIDPTFLEQFHNLKQIILNNNNLDTNQTNNFWDCVSLQVVSLSHNKLTSLGNLVKVINLEFLILNNNRITSVDGISNLKKLKLLDISHNNISVIPNGFQNMHLVELDLSFNNITIFEDCRNVFETVKLKNNKLEILCKFANTIKEIDYSDNVVANIDENSFKELTKLKKLDLSKNEVEEISFGVFKDLSELRYLNLSHNYIAVLELGCFAYLRSLTTLDLKFNSLKHLDIGIFTGLSTLEYLDLSYNYIYKFDATTILSLQNLNYLYLEKVGIDEETVEKFSEYFPYLISISLSFTNVGCDRLINIIKNFKSNVINVKKGSVRYRDNINGIYCDSSIKNATETIEEIQLYNVLKSMSRIYGILIVVCIIIISIVLSTIIKKSFDMSKKYKNISNARIL